MTMNTSTSSIQGDKPLGQQQVGPQEAWKVDRDSEAGAVSSVTNSGIQMGATRQGVCKGSKRDPSIPGHQLGQAEIECWNRCVKSL